MSAARQSRNQKELTPKRTEPRISRISRIVPRCPNQFLIRVIREIRGKIFAKMSDFDILRCKGQMDNNCEHLRAIPDAIAAGRAVFLAGKNLLGNALFLAFAGHKLLWFCPILGSSFPPRWCGGGRRGWRVKKISFLKIKPFLLPPPSIRLQSCKLIQPRKFVTLPLWDMPPAEKPC